MLPPSPPPSSLPSNLPALLTIARQAAQAACKAVLKGWQHRNALQIHSKGAGDLVTSTDHAAETAALTLLRQACPDHAFLSEEVGPQGAPPDQTDYLWVLDPLDGSLNFAHGIPHFAVSVACLYRGQPVVGVIIDPLRQETFHALRAGGAWLNNQRIQVSPCQQIAEAVLATVFPKPGSAQMQPYLPSLEQALTQAAAVRRSGAMVLDLAWLAAGRMDGFWQSGMAAWDLCAGSLLVEEAGGQMRLPPGTHWLNAQACVAASPALINGLTHLLGPFYLANAPEKHREQK